MATILHVEDDSSLADLVELAFEGFGFRGTMLKAETVAQAEELLDEQARQAKTIDLIISDMTLPDGTGLDVVRYARANPTWKRTPILMLSGDADPYKVGRAYALGANSYVSKAPRGRSVADVVKTLYTHWLKDVVLASTPQVDRVSTLLTKAITIRSRCAAHYVRMAEQFGDSPSEAAFWLTRALSESNLANLLTFLKGQVGESSLPGHLLDDLEQAQREAERELAAFEREADDQPVTTRDEAYRRMLELITIFISHSRVHRFARSISHLFPVAPVAMEALRDFLARDLDDVAGWIDIHTRDPKLHLRSTSLREAAAFVRRLPEERTATHAAAEHLHPG